MKANLKAWFTKQQNWWLYGVIALAGWFRLWRLNSLPPGLHPDEAANGLDIFKMFSGDLRVLYDSNGPREALFFYLQAPFVWLFNNSILALRLAPALLGVAAVTFTYLWAKEWFDKKTALYSGFFYGIGVWAITLSRDGYRANMVPLVLAINAWATTLAIKTRKWQWAALSGVSYAAGLYTYFSYRLIALALVAILIFAFIKHRSVLLELKKQVGVALLSGVIALIPLGIYAIDHPTEVLVGRSSVAFTNPELNGGQPLQTLADTTVKTALMFNVKGDPNYRHNLGGAPMLDAATGIFFILGLLLCLRKFNDIRYFALLTGFGSMLLPEIVTAEGIPHGLRAIGVLPIVYILAALGLMELINRFRAVFPKNLFAKGFLSILVGMTLIAATAYSYQRYFVAWANAPETYEAYSEDAVAAAKFMNQNSFAGKRYLVIGGYSDQTVAYLTKGKSSYSRLEPSGPADIDYTQPVQLIVLASELSQFEPLIANTSKPLVSRDVLSDARINVTLFRIYETNN